MCGLAACCGQRFSGEICDFVDVLGGERGFDAFWVWGIAIGAERGGWQRGVGTSEMDLGGWGAGVRGGWVLFEG